MSLHASLEKLQVPVPNTAPPQEGLSHRMAAATSTRVLPIADVDENLQTQWESLRAASRVYRSPFFSFAFLRAVSEVGLKVEAAVQTAENELVIALPFARHAGRLAMPAGLGINDAHGFLKRGNYQSNPTEFLSASGLQSFRFHAAPPELFETQQYAVGSHRSFLADLRVDPRGYEHYLRHNSDTIDRQGQKTRRLIRKSGPLRLDFDCRDPRMIDYLIKLKGEQYQRTHTYDILAVDWIRRLLHRLHADKDSLVRGIVSVLYAGDQVVALHYGLVERDWLHYWFPVYDAQYSYGSPGTVLFVEIAKQAEEHGFTAIDMGYGEQPYKHKLTNVITEMSYGLIDCSPLRRAIYRTQLAWNKRIKQLWLKELVKPIVRKAIPKLGAKRYGG
jgi:CelD/BcsL family acetyltransferase involved in cellulose biosynthesis